MKIDIGDFHEEEQVATIDDQGNLETDSGAFEEVARPLIEEGVYVVYPFSATGKEGGDEIMYREFNVKPGTEGWLREFVDEIPSPYDCDLSKLDELPVFEPEEYMQEKMEKDDFPPWCRSCGEKRRMSGSFVCPTCHPDEDEDGHDGSLAEDTKEKMLDGVFDVLKSRTYIDDPSEAPDGVQVEEGNRGGLYYETGERSGITQDEPGTSYTEDDIFGSIDEAREEAKSFYHENIEGEDVASHGDIGVQRSSLGEAWAPLISRMMMSGVDKSEILTDDPFEREDWETSLDQGINTGGVSAAWETVSHNLFGASMHFGHSDEIARQFTEEFIDEEVRDTSGRVYDAWMSWSDEDATSPLWTLAAQESGNGEVPDDGLLGADEQDVEDMKEYVETSREAFKNTFGEEITVHRALDGEIAKEVKQAVENGEDVEIEHRTLEAWTTAPDFVDYFQNKHVADDPEDDVVVITDTVSVDKIYGSSFDSPELGRRNQGEVIVGDEGETVYSSDQVRMNEQGMVDSYSMVTDTVKNYQQGAEDDDEDEYEDIEHCIEENQDKREPEAYCAAVFGLAGEGVDDEEEKSVGVTVSADESWYDWPRYVLQEEEQEKDNAVTTGSSGYSNATYGGVSGTTLNYDHWESQYMDLNKAMKAEDMSYADMDDLLFNAFKRTVWWEPTDGDDLSKAPNMWESADEVPEFVKAFIEEVINQNVVFDSFENLPHTAALKIQEIFRENLQQPQGWSVHSLVDDLRDAFPSLATQQAETIIRTETAAIMNSAREEAYKERDDSDEYEFYWSNAQDHRTTDLCGDIIEEIESRGGAVPLDELRKIVKDASGEYDYGTPQRADEWMPHYNCRSTFVRKVYL